MFQYMFNNLAHRLDNLKLRNPTGGQIRDCDDYGCGKYGASRGGRSHAGIDIEATPGQDVASPADGRLGEARPYRDHLEVPGVRVAMGDGIEVRMFYVQADKSLLGSNVLQTQTMGTAYSLQRLYPGITDHVHLELRVDGKSVDPTPYVR